MKKSSFAYSYIVSSIPLWQQHPTRHQLYGHLPPITKTIQVRRTRHAGHCWRSRDELIRDVLLWIPTHGRAKAGRPARTYIQQLCEDTGCCPEDLPRAMNDREEWRERVRDIRATSAIWWWWFPSKTRYLNTVILFPVFPSKTHYLQIIYIYANDVFFMGILEIIQQYVNEEFFYGNTGNHTIVNKLYVLDSKSWHHETVCKNTLNFLTLRHKTTLDVLISR